MHFSHAQLDRLANILDNAGQVFLAVMALTQVVQGIDKSNTLVLVFGVIDTGLCWTASLILARRKEEQLQQ